MSYHRVDMDEKQRAITAVGRPSNEAAAFQTFVQNWWEIGGDYNQQYKKVVQKDKPKKESTDEPE